MGFEPTRSFAERFLDFVRTVLGPGVRDLIVNHAEKLVGTKYDAAGNRGSGYLDDDKMDCSELVYQAYTRAGVTGFPPLNSHAIAGSSDFEKVDTPLKGDVVYWSQGHVAIVTNPDTGEFVGSQTSTGVARSNYLLNVYWKARPGRAFYRFKKLTPR